MTYRSRGRSVFEVIVVSDSRSLLFIFFLSQVFLSTTVYQPRLPIFFPQAICFVAFLVGFILVLCIGNYYRAKRAAERQRQRRLTKLAESNAGKVDRSSFFSNTSINRGDGTTSDIGTYDPPRLQPESTALA